MKNDVTDVNSKKGIRSIFNIRTSLIVLAILIGISLGGVAIGSISTNAKVKAQIELGNKYIQEGNYKEAIIAFEKAIEIEPKNVDARLRLAKAYTEVGRITDAIRVLKEVIDIDKKREEPYLELANIYIDENKLDEAIRILEIGYENTGNEEIKKMIEELKAKPPPPKASIEGGKYESIQLVELVAEGNNIYYTLDGSKPSMKSIKYSQSVTISNGITTLRAIAIDAKGKTSEESRHEYTVEMPIIAVSFEDREFEKMLRKIINRPSGEIYNTDLIDIKEIIIFGKIAKNPDHCEYTMGLEEVLYWDENESYEERGKIKSLNDLKWFKRLERLDMSYQEISDISMISDLKNLMLVDLSYNNITDISPLKNMTNLKALHLAGVKLDDISWLSNFLKLTSLTLESNKIEDISPLAKLTNLTDLYLRGNKIKDISPLYKLTNLIKLSLGNQINDINPLAELTNLYYLDLSVNQIRDISPLENLAGLHYVFLQRNRISDINPLKNLTKLEKVHLADNDIDDYIPIDNLRNIQIVLYTDIEEYKRTRRDF